MRGPLWIIVLSITVGTTYSLLGLLDNLTDNVNIYPAAGEALDLFEKTTSTLGLLPGGGGEDRYGEPKDQLILLKEYDFIIVGAGSAGCVLANRLTENPKWKVLLIEAGGPENFLMDIPAYAITTQLTSANWHYLTEPSNSSCLGMANGQCHWPRGKVMGGSSVLNYMIFTRGNKKDYDGWEAKGNEGWSWDNVLPYFKKVEDFVVPEYQSDTTYHGHEGYMTVSSVPYRSKVADAFVEAGRYTGQPIVDFNGPTQTGFNYLQTTMKNGVRWSSNSAYLGGIQRSNLHVKKFSQVTRILIDPQTKTATGIEFVNNNRRYKVRAKREVILSAGTINSAQLLMLSGIGPKEHLRDMDIPVLADLPVGFNLQDHVSSFLTYTIVKPYALNFVDSLPDLPEYLLSHKGPLSTPSACEAIAFYDLQNPKDPNGYPDLEILEISSGAGFEPLIATAFNLNSTLTKQVFGKTSNQPQITLTNLVLRPKSVGRVMLASKNPISKPLLYPNYFTDPENNDISVAIAGIRKANELLETPAFKAMGAKLLEAKLPACEQFKFDSDEYWQCYTRQWPITIYHYVGTAKMGPSSDPTAVVDPRLRVHGIKRLRVIDASIMPVIPAAHTNAPTLMIAEKAADIIKEDLGIKTEN